MKSNRRTNRFFSEELKRGVVKDVEQGKTSVTRAAEEFGVSKVTIYRWLDKYSSYLKKGAKLIVELKSENYRSRELEKKVRDLEAALGRKQLEVDFLNKLIEIASEDLGIDIKKKSSTPRSTGSDSIGRKGGVK